MKLSIIYSIINKFVNYDHIIKNLKNIDYKFVEIIFIVQNNCEETFNFFKSLNLKNAETKIFFSWPIESHAYSYNLGFREASNDYIILATDNLIFLDNFSQLIDGINGDYDIIFFNSLKKGNESNFKEAFSYEKIRFWNMIISKKILLENEIFLSNFTKMFLEFIFLAVKFSKKILLETGIFISSDFDKRSTYSAYYIIKDAEKLFHKIDEMDDIDDKEYYKAIITTMILYEFLRQINLNYLNDHLVFKNAILNANNSIMNLYPFYKNNKYLNLWKNNPSIKFILNFKPTLRYCLKGFLGEK
ncbi:MAG: glycosyltransferase family A protein [Mycoplasmoidaceae bacterium]